MANQQSSAAAKFIHRLTSSSNGSSIAVEGVFFVSIKASLIGSTEVELALRSCLSNALCRIARAAQLPEPLLHRVDVERAAVRSALTAAVLGDGAPPRPPLKTESAASFMVSLANHCIRCANAKINSYLLVLEQAMGSSKDAAARLPAPDFAVQLGGASDGLTHVIEGVCVIDETRAAQAMGLESRFECLLRSILAPSQQIGPSAEDLVIALARLCDDPCASLMHGAGRTRLHVSATADPATGGEELSLLEGRYHAYAALHSALSEYIFEPLDANIANGVCDADAMVSSVLRPYVKRLEARGWAAAGSILEGGSLSALHRVFSKRTDSVPFYEIGLLVIEWIVGIMSARLNASRSGSGEGARGGGEMVLLPWRRGPETVPSTLPWYLHKQYTRRQPELIDGTHAAVDAADTVSRKRPWDFHGHEEETAEELEASEFRSVSEFSSPSGSSASSGRLRMRSASPPRGLGARSPSPLPPSPLPLPAAREGTGRSRTDSPPPFIPTGRRHSPPSGSPSLEEFNANVNALYDSFYS
jgi:hypothetical protein